ncbi:hypothetical protein ICE98_00680 [Lactococcus lactis]|nr:hypothetical protein [Lactococcus lactis]
MMVDDIVYYAAFVLPIILILLYFFTNYNFTGDQAKFYQRLFKIGGAVYAVTFLANYVSLTGNASNSMTLTELFDGNSNFILSVCPHFFLWNAIAILKRYFHERKHLGYILVAINGFVNLLLIMDGFFWFVGSL